MSKNDQFWRGTSPRAWAPADWSLGALHPRADMCEDENGFEISIDLPGVDEQGIQLVLDNNVLTIWGQVAPSKPERAGSFLIMERAAGAFRRSIPIPAKVDESKVCASFRNGVLTVSLPKEEPSEPGGKRIPINPA